MIIEWLVAFLIINPDDPDPTKGVRYMSKTSETNCREMAARLRYGQEFETVVEGQPMHARFEFCLWTRNGEIQDFVRHE
jgi:hypothetical protein